MRAFTRAWVAGALLLAAADACAVECAPISGGYPTLGTIDAEVRLQFLRNRLARGARRARIWSWTWAGLYSSLTVGNLALLPTKSKDEKVDSYVGSAASFVGVAVLMVSPMKIMTDQRWLERRVRMAPPGSDRCALVADAERLLVRDAADAEFGRSPIVHMGNFVFNIGIGLLLGLAFHHWEEAGITAGVGIAVGEIQIVTRPMDAVGDLRRYQLGNLGLPPAWRPAQWTLAPFSTSPRDLGLAVVGIF